MGTFFETQCRCNNNKATMYMALASSIKLQQHSEKCIIPAAIIDRTERQFGTAGVEGVKRPSNYPHSHCATPTQWVRWQPQSQFSLSQSSALRPAQQLSYQLVLPLVPSSSCSLPHWQQQNNYVIILFYLFIIYLFVNLTCSPVKCLRKIINVHRPDRQNTKQWAVEKTGEESV